MTKNAKFENIITKKKKILVFSSRITIYHLIRKNICVVTSLCGWLGLSTFDVSHVDLHQEEYPAVDSEHGREQRHNLQSVEDDGLERSLCQSEHHEENQHHKDDHSLEEDPELDKERLNQNEGDLSKHDNYFPEVKLQGVSSEEKTQFLAYF